MTPDERRELVWCVALANTYSELARKRPAHDGMAEALGEIDAQAARKVADEAAEMARVHFMKSAREGTFRWSWPI